MQTRQRGDNPNQSKDLRNVADKGVCGDEPYNGIGTTWGGTWLMRALMGRPWVGRPVEVKAVAVLASAEFHREPGVPWAALKDVEVVVARVEVEAVDTEDVCRR